VVHDKHHPGERRRLSINNCLKRTFRIKVPTMKIMDDFRCQWKPSHAYHKSALSAVSKTEWDTKKGTGKSIKNALYVQWYGKRHLK